jgi:hypothetical protein
MEHHDDVGYEKRDVNVIKVLIPTLLSGVIIAVFLVGLDQYFLITKEKMYFDQVLKPESVALKELQQKEFQTLTNYKVIDKDRGTYQIPIERAMELEVSEKSK